MSVWTHFSGEFTFMSDHNIETELMNKLGKPITFDEMWESMGGISEDRWSIPHGSEGSIQYHCISFYSIRYKVWKTKLIISGNLRDYYLDTTGIRDRDITEWLLRLKDFQPCLDFDDYKVYDKGETVYVNNHLIVEEDDGIFATYWLTDKFTKRIICDWKKDNNDEFVYDDDHCRVLDWEKSRMYEYEGNEWVFIPEEEEE